MGPRLNYTVSLTNHTGCIMTMRRTEEYIWRACCQCQGISSSVIALGPTRGVTITKPINKERRRNCRHRPSQNNLWPTMQRSERAGTDCTALRHSGWNCGGSLSAATQGRGWLQSKAERADNPFGSAEYSICCLRLKRPWRDFCLVCSDVHFCLQ